MNKPCPRCEAQMTAKYWPMADEHVWTCPTHYMVSMLTKEEVTAFNREASQADEARLQLQRKVTELSESNARHKKAYSVSRKQQEAMRLLIENKQLRELVRSLLAELKTADTDWTDPELQLLVARAEEASHE